MTSLFAHSRIPCWALTGLLLLPGAVGSQTDLDATPLEGTRVAQADSDPMLRCARMPDVASQIRCFDEVKRRSSKGDIRNEPRDDPPSNVLREDTREAVQSNTWDESRLIARYAQEVTRELGKEMYQDEYPRRAREEGRGGTTELLLRIDSDAKLAQVTVSRSSGYSDLDQFALTKVANLRLPKVPEKIRSPVFSFRLPVSFAIRAAPR